MAEYTAEEIFADEVAFQGMANAVAVHKGGVDGVSLLLPLGMRESYVSYVKVRNNADLLRQLDAQQIAKYNNLKQFWEKGPGVQIMNGVTNSKLVLDSLTKIVEQIAGPKVIDCLKSKANEKLRDAFEVSTPITQCNNTVGPYVLGETECWICGCVIPNMDDGEWSVGQREALKPECEHIFPVAQALCFTGLYDSQIYRQLNDPTPEVANEYREGVRIEYRWAHKICNQVKNELHFIDIDTETNTFVIDGTRIQPFLQKIATTPSYGGGQALLDFIKTQTQQDGMAWLLGRQEAIQTMCQTIINMVNEIGLTLEEHKHATIMCMMAYINSKECGEFVEGNIPKIPPIAKPGVANVIYGVQHLLKNTSIRNIVDRIRGIVNLEISKLSRQDFPVKTRILLGNTLLGITNELKSELERGYTDEVLYNLDLQVLRRLRRLGYDDRTVLSKFGPQQAIYVQYIIYKDAVYLFNKKLEEQSASDSGVESFINNQSIQTSISQWYTETLSAIKEIDPEIENYEKQPIKGDFAVPVGYVAPGDIEAPTSDDINVALQTLVNMGNIQTQKDVNDAVAGLLAIGLPPPNRAAAVLLSLKQEGGLRKRFHFKLNDRSTSSRVSRTSKHSRLRKRTGKGGTYRVRQSAGKSRTWRQRLSLGSLRPSIPSYYGGNSNVQSDVEWGSFYANN